MTARSILRCGHTKHRTHRPALELVALDQKENRQRLHADGHVLEFGSSGNIPFTHLARGKHEAVRFDLTPELFVVHRVNPFFNVFDMLENFHAGIVAEIEARLQISDGRAAHDD